MNEVAWKMETLKRQLETMKSYLKLRLEVEDWHGVQDAASDIRELESQMLLLLELHRDQVGVK
jgi:hypothetical protein